MPDLPNLANLEYVRRVNRAVYYVTQNLAEPLRLEDVARAACFSPCHFHRIFHTAMGETLASFEPRSRAIGRGRRAHRLLRGLAEGGPEFRRVKLLCANCQSPSL